MAASTYAPLPLLEPPLLPHAASTPTTASTKNRRIPEPTFVQVPNTLRTAGAELADQRRGCTAAGRTAVRVRRPARTEHWHRYDRPHLARPSDPALARAPRGAHRAPGMGDRPRAGDAGVPHGAVPR